MHVVIHVREHEFFERDGDDLHVALPIDLEKAVLGGNMDVPTLEGKRSIKIPSGTQSGDTIRVAGGGIRGHGRDDKGALFLHVSVEIPVKLNGKQKDKLLEFTQSLGDSNGPIQKSFLSRAKNFFK